jgi:hypothetical protein
MAPRRRDAVYVLLAVLGSSGAVGCGGQVAHAGSDHSTTAALNRYLSQIEPIRLGVNRLLDGADPVLNAVRERRVTPAQAARRMGELEQRFAA